MNPPSVEQSLAEPTRPSLGARIAKNLHLVIPGAVLVVLSAALLIQAQQEETQLGPAAPGPSEDSIKDASQVEFQAPSGLLEDELERQRRVAALPGVVPMAEVPPMPIAQPSLPPIPNSRPSPEIDKERLRQEQIRASQIIAIQGSASARGIAARGPGDIRPGSPEEDSRLAQMRRQAEQIREHSQRRQDEIMKVSTAPQTTSDEGQPRASRNQSSLNSNEAWLRDAQRQTRPPETIGLVPATMGPVIHQGVVIPTVLTSEINSDLPGQIQALVSMDVYDSVKGKSLLIPKGSRLVGQYNSNVNIGQERVMAAFQRLILPNGTSVNLAGMQAADQMGASGLEGDVNNHFWRMFSSSFMIAAISWAFDKNSPSTVVINNSSAEEARSITGEILQDISRTILDRNRVIAPTITIDKGMKLNVVVNKDIAIPAYIP